MKKKYTCLVLASLIVSAARAEIDYRKKFQVAAVLSQNEKLESLLKRRNKLPLKVLKDTMGWADDILEERKTLENTFTESLSRYMGWFMGSWTAVSYFGFSNNLFGYNQGAMHPLEIAQYKFKAAAWGLFSVINLYRGHWNPRSRLAKAYRTKFCLDAAYKKRLEELEDA